MKSKSGFSVAAMRSRVVCRSSFVRLHFSSYAWFADSHKLVSHLQEESRSVGGNFVFPAVTWEEKTVEVQTNAPKLDRFD